MLLIIDNKKLDKKNWKTNADGRPSGLENAKSFLLEIGTKKIITDEARYLYDSFIKQTLINQRNQRVGVKIRKIIF